MERNDGGPAFPCPPVEVTCSERGETWKETTGGQGGMSLRDWFASQAMVGILSHPTTRHTSELISESAYKVADAMLKERSK